MFLFKNGHFWSLLELISFGMHSLDHVNTLRLQSLTPNPQTGRDLEDHWPQIRPLWVLINLRSKTHIFKYFSVGSNYQDDHLVILLIPASEMKLLVLNLLNASGIIKRCAERD